MFRRAVLAVVLAGLCVPSAAAARTRDVWVKAVPTTWSVVPSGRDPIENVRYPAHETTFPTVVYRRYTRNWKRALPGRIPGPLIRARVGDEIRVHFKNGDSLRKDPHSMHFHGVGYKPSSDGAWMPGFSGRDAKVEFGETWTYRLRAGERARGVWPYHDHSTAMMDSLEGGMYGALSIIGRNERWPDREHVVVFAPMHGFQTINGRAFLGNTPVFKARVGEVVQWNVLALGSEHHTFHVHGHGWVGPDGDGQDTRTLGPAESFRVRWREDAPGTWFFHCHVEDHMMRGMIGIYRVRR